MSFTNLGGIFRAAKIPSPICRARVQARLGGARTACPQTRIIMDLRREAGRDAAFGRTKKSRTKIEPRAAQAVSRLERGSATRSGCAKPDAFGITNDDLKIECAAAHRAALRKISRLDAAAGGAMLPTQ